MVDKYGEFVLLKFCSKILLSSKIQKVNSQKNLKFKDSKILRLKQYLII